MARRARGINKQAAPDAKYNSEILSRFVNKLMIQGKKSVAEGIIYGALTIMEEKGAKEPAATLQQAVNNATPQLEVKPRRVGGATYQVPVEVESKRGQALAMRWLISAARTRAGKTMAEKLAAELSDAAQNQGATIKKREDTHKMAEANRAFAHYRW
jgi:small subunit ribosomal protein S7